MKKQMAIATKQRFVVSGGMSGWEEHEVSVRVLAIAEGYAMVRCKGAMPFVISVKDLKLCKS